MLQNCVYFDTYYMTQETQLQASERHLEWNVKSVKKIFVYNTSWNSRFTLVEIKSPKT